LSDLKYNYLNVFRIVVELLEALQMNIRKKDARVLLIKEGKKIIFEEGYENLTIKRLTTVCQMATGTFYNYFDNKKELVITIVVRAWDQMLGEIDAATALPMALRDKIMIVNERFVKFATLYHPLFVHMSSEFTLDEYDDIRRGGFEKLYSRVNRLLREALANEEIYSLPIDSYKLAIVLVQNMILSTREPRLDFAGVCSCFRFWVKNAAVSGGPV